MYYEFKGTLNKIGIEKGKLYIEVTGDVNHQLKGKDKNYNVFITHNSHKEVSQKGNIILKEDEKLFVKGSQLEELLYHALEKGKVISIFTEVQDISQSDMKDENKISEPTKGSEDDMKDTEVVIFTTDDNVQYVFNKIEVSK